MCRCFISHAWAGGGHAFAIRLAEALEANGIDVWLDRDQILAGQHVRYRMQTGVRDECDAFLFILSPGSLRSEACAIELDEAYKCRNSKGLQIIPVLFKKCRVPPDLKVPRYVDLRDRSRFDEQVGELLSAIWAARQVRTLVTLLIHSDPDSREEAAQRLARLRNPFVVPILARRLYVDRDTHPTVRHWLAHALGQIDTEEACVALRTALENEDDLYARLGIEDALKERCPP